MVSMTTTNDSCETVVHLSFIYIRTQQNVIIVCDFVVKIFSLLILFNNFWGYNSAIYHKQMVFLWVCLASR